MAAAYLQLSPSSLRERGPAPKHVGRSARWDKQDLDRWVDAIGGQPLDREERVAEGDDINRRVEERLRKNASG